MLKKLLDEKINIKIDYKTIEPKAIELIESNFDEGFVIREIYKQRTIKRIISTILTLLFLFLFLFLIYLKWQW